VLISTALFESYPMMIDDVVAMSAARSGLETGRAVEMADAEIREVINDRQAMVESKPRMKLYAISGT